MHIKTDQGPVLFHASEGPVAGSCRHAPVSSAWWCGSPGPDHERDEMLQWHQALEEDLPSDDEDGDAETVLPGEVDECRHGRGHVVASGLLSLKD
jgi:hypothetical protein